MSEPFRAFRFSSGFEDLLLQRIRGDFLLRGPVRGEDGVVRISPVERWGEMETRDPPLLPPKKEVLPQRETLWTLSDGTYKAPSPSSRTAILGLFPCDLYGISYLDRIFSEDRLYRLRRRNLLLVGRLCSPRDECFCPPGGEPPAFDLFIGESRVWTSSRRGIECLQGLREELEEEECPLPPEVMGGRVQAQDSLEGYFQSSRERPFWKQVGKRCFSCGACSAVCPTCYCFDIVDNISTDGEIERRREWDNCFFRSHGMVAGGHNFRPGRGDRLRFRFEHKFLGFGDFRGAQSCVGCGRCRKACPADIDLQEVLALVTSGGGKP